MKKEILEVEIKIDKANKSIEDVNEKVDDLAKGVKSVGEASKKTEKEVKGIGTAVKGIGTALKAAGIGLVIALFTQLSEIFKSNQKVADAFATVTETLSLVFNEFVNTLVSVYESVSKATGGFDALGKVIKGLITIGITPLKLGFYGIKLGIQQAQLIWEKSFFGGNDKGKIQELNKGILETKLAIGGVASDAIDAGKNIAKNIVEAAGEVTSFVTESIEKVSKISVKGAYENAKSIVELKKTAAVAAELQAGLIEKNDRLAEKQRQIRDNDLLSIEDRKKANDELLKILNQQEIDMTKQAKLQTAAAQADFDKNSSTANYTALLAAQNNELGIKAQIEGFLSEQIVNRVALEKEANDLLKSKTESTATLAIEEKKFLDEQIENDLQRLEAQRNTLEKEKERELDRLQFNINNLAIGTQARVDAQSKFNAKKQELDQKLLDNEKNIELARKNIKLKALDDLTKIVGAETGLGKALLIAKQLLLAKELALEISRTIAFSTQAVARSIVAVSEGTAQTAKIGFPQNIPMLIGYAAQAVGIISAIKGAAKASSSISGGAGISIPQSVSVPQIQAPQAQSPSFNIVGSSGTNQLATAIGSQTQQPIQAYVVSNDITSAQSLDRNIVESSSLG